MTNEIIELGYPIELVERVKEEKAYTVYMDLARKDRQMIYQLVQWIKQLRDAKEK